MRDEYGWSLVSVGPISLVPRASLSASALLHGTQISFSPHIRSQIPTEELSQWLTRSPEPKVTGPARGMETRLVVGGMRKGSQPWPLSPSLWSGSFGENTKFGQVSPVS